MESIPDDQDRRGRFEIVPSLECTLVWYLVKCPNPPSLLMSSKPCKGVSGLGSGVNRQVVARSVTSEALGRPF